MRIIVPGKSEKECKKMVDLKKRDGWNPITDIKLDTSGDGDIRWVCVMEKPDTPEMIEKRKNSRFNVSMVSRLR